MLPTMDGLEVCRKLRAQASYGVHVIIVSARKQEEDILRGLELGADDYVGKPFSIKEIVARIRTVLRRVPAGTTHRNPDEIISHPPLSLSTASHEVHLEEIPVQLTATEYRLLHLLMSQPGRIFSRQQMLAQVGEQRAHLTGRNIDVHVRALRRKFGHHAAMIDTARGVGYRFVPNPIESPAPAPAC
jgi:DNA-binding response OmpR family regulator